MLRSKIYSPVFPAKVSEALFLTFKSIIYHLCIIKFKRIIPLIAAKNFLRWVFCLFLVFKSLIWSQFLCKEGWIM